MYRIVASLELRPGIALFSPSNLFYTDGSLMDGVAGFAVHHSIDCNIGFWMRGPASVFMAELAAICMAMDHMENEALGRYLILTDSMSSIRAIESRKISLHTHPFVYECKPKCWQLTRSSREVSFMWVAHMLELREMKRLILRRDRQLWAIWCTMHNRLLGIFFQSRNTMLDE
jgi:ribonuclease HI